ncbi:Rv1355c family protein [Mucilaginibacter sp. PAMB04274]|uniref:Rv1355c family protein n=1 Tax=Mucilaginibacter sp. PAMB04274 TaxID=3138568 RepID=UPI0031F61B65
MINNYSTLYTSPEDNLVYQPQFFNCAYEDQKSQLNDLLAQGRVLRIHDSIQTQLQELIKSRNPAAKIGPDDYKRLIEAHLAGRPLEDYGLWVFYPWSRSLVHLVEEEEFIEVRTNRNQLKITQQEQQQLREKKIGIVGLSVGQSIALTLAMERTCGELRLADFDTAELSNLNRLRTGVHNMGLNKTVIAAREIAEIDPFLKVKLFHEGLHQGNIDAFFTGDGKLDLFIEVCDGLDIKIESRFKARELNIPVVMDTNDRGMLDVERFDLEPDRPILHGLTEGLDPSNIKSLSNEDKIPYILKMVGAETISTRMKVSMMEVQQSINTWPQLASSVVLGGALTTDVCRRILLNEFHESGRYYVDLEELVADKKTVSPAYVRSNPFTPLAVDEMKLLAQKTPAIYHNAQAIKPDARTIETLVQAACAAPSTGNDQPWKWLYTNGTLFLYHDEHRSYSFGDFRKMASFISFGAAYENLNIQALSMGLQPHLHFMPNNSSERLVAAISFGPAINEQQADLLTPLQGSIFTRHTNRNLAGRADLQQPIFDQLTLLTESIPGAKLHCFTEADTLRELGKIIGACDRIRLLNKEGHHDFVHHEMRWTSEDAEATKDGIDVKTLGLSNSQLAALGVIKGAEVVQSINDFGGGKALDMLATRTVAAASALCFITLPQHGLQSFFDGGRAMERFWLAATQLNIAVHPVISPLYIFPRIVYGNGEGLSEQNQQELQQLRERFIALTGIDNNQAEVFLTKIAIANEPDLKSFRLPIHQTLFID